MGVYFEILLVFIIGGIIFALFYIIRGAVFTPVPETKGATLYTLVSVSGDADRLEQTVDGILWLNKSGTMKSSVIIADCGLSPSGRKIADLLEKDSSCVYVCKPEDIAKIIKT